MEDLDGRVDYLLRRGQVQRDELKGWQYMKAPEQPDNLFEKSGQARLPRTPRDLTAPTEPLEPEPSTDS